MTDGTYDSNSRVAIVGVAARFPGASTMEAFWRNLDEGVESISSFSKEELLASALDPDLISLPNYVPRRAVLPDLEKFDAAFFGITRAKPSCSIRSTGSSSNARGRRSRTRATTPASWTARPSGVFAGVGMNSYVLHESARQAGAVRIGRRIPVDAGEREGLPGLAASPTS